MFVITEDTVKHITKSYINKCILTSILGVTSCIMFRTIISQQIKIQELTAENKELKLKGE